MSEFEIIQIPTSSFRYNQELEGILAKGWINHPTIGRALFKEAAANLSRLKESRTDWSEKVVSELNQLLKLPAARYELATVLDSLSLIPGSLSYSVHQPGDRTRITLEEFLLNTLPQYDYPQDYSPNNIIQALAQNNVELPPNYSVPDGINDGADMFIGILMLDAWIGNSDRHDHNLEIVEANNMQLYLSPVFDNGSSLGASEKQELRSKISIEQYNNEYNFSCFEDGNGQELTGLGTFKKAASLRPLAASTWLNQLAQIQPEQINHIFNQIPEALITNEAKVFAQNLLEYNRVQLLDLSQEINLELNLEQEQRAREILPVVIEGFSYQRQNNQTYIKGNLEIFEGQIYRITWNASESILELAGIDNRGILARYNLKEQEPKVIMANNITIEDVNQWETIQQQTIENVQTQQQNRGRGFTR